MTVRCGRAAALVQVTVAGSGDAFGSGGRLQTCLHLQPADRTEAVLVDCGSSALIGLKQRGLEPNDVTVVAISHLHGDHFGGLPYLLTWTCRPFGPTGTVSGAPGCC